MLIEVRDVWCSIVGGSEGIILGGNEGYSIDDDTCFLAFCGGIFWFG